jgi:hypothetical protein
LGQAPFAACGIRRLISGSILRPWGSTVMSIGVKRVRQQLLKNTELGRQYETALL